MPEAQENVTSWYARELAGLRAAWARSSAAASVFTAAVGTQAPTVVLSRPGEPWHFRGTSVFTPEPITPEPITPEPITPIIPRTKEKNSMKADPQILSDIVTDFIARTAWATSQTVLLDSKGSREVGVAIRKLKKDYDKFIGTLTVDDMVETNERVLWVYKTPKGYEFQFLANPFTEEPVATVYVTYMLSPKVHPRAAADALRSVLPKWVEVTLTNEGVYIDTKRGRAYRQALDTQVGAGLALLLAGSDYVRSSSFMNVYTVARSFSISSTKYVIEEMRKISKQESVDKQVSKPVRSGGGDFGRYLDTMRANVTTERVIETLPLQPHGLKSSRNWGIEIESGGSRGAETPVGWEAKYDGSLSSAYTGIGSLEHEDCEEDHRLSLNAVYIDTLGEYVDVPNPDWMNPDECDTCVNNSRIDNEEWNDEGEDGDCKEFVSPILHSYHSKGLEKLVAQLSTQPQNDSAGVHVHVDVPDLSPRQIGSLVYGYNLIEPLITSSYRRECRNYCKVRPASELRRVARSAKTAGFKTDLDVGDRYVSLNLQSLRAHGTVEFRAMGPVYEYEYLIRWAHFCREMVNVSKTATVRDWNAIKSFADLQKLFAAKGSETVDNSLSIISESDIEDMFERNDGEDVYVDMAAYELVSGEI